MPLLRMPPLVEKALAIRWQTLTDLNQKEMTVSLTSPTPSGSNPAAVKETHLVTGATGFVGGALVLELLRRTRHDVVVLVRSTKSQTAAARFHDAITHATQSYGDGHLLADLNRCRVVAGDVTLPGCGLVEGLDCSVTQVWHCAASLQFEDRHRESIRATNVDGTRHVVELAQRLGASALNYISTAYVAGRATGLIPERREPEAQTNNHYERSKIDAEALVAAAPLRVRILRPSIVVGHSRTLAATSFSGYYGFIRQLMQFRGVMECTQRGLLDRTPLRLRGDADALFDMAFVDLVAREAVAIGTRQDTEGVFHLTHPAAGTVGEAVRMVFNLLKLPEPIFVSTRSELSWLDEQLDKRLEFYGSYGVGYKQFERSRTDAALSEPILHPKVELEALGRWYLDVLEGTRSNLPVAR
jgi:nucleoside-diphosphate-sugar epimerase